MFGKFDLFAFGLGICYLVQLFGFQDSRQQHFPRLKCFGVIVLPPIHVEPFAVTETSLTTAYKLLGS